MKLSFAQYWDSTLYILKLGCTSAQRTAPPYEINFFQHWLKHVKKKQFSILMNHVSQQ